jgi:hypothetical protein
LAAWVEARFRRRRRERDQSRRALVDIDPSDLSEAGRRARAEVLRDRRTRALLRALDDRALKDIGLTRADLPG